MPPGLELGIAQLGDWVTTATALHDVAADLTSPTAFINAVPDVLNAYLNGQDTLSLLNGSITIPAWNGILAPLQPVDINLSLTNLLDALGLGNLSLSNLDLSSLLGNLGLGDLTVGSLFSDLGLSTLQLKLVTVPG
ncbi:hypothetical protein [Candidatus Mycobacterium methanotrophicum]|uniref:hypothetical protein n=1 Tax=Candidatus Mycobacterium methanotrophicum TaxID=2943498 RepID=UPI001C58D3D6|nr:hypothetical protein [Candidatus Mycobacterium methanotrophicum]